jgi:hypothetical protein
MLTFNDFLKKYTISTAKKRYIKFITKRRMRRKSKREMYNFLTSNKNIKNITTLSNNF